ncbi:response regulator [uncultured Bradyrhizobium sp.]|jgi:CheY-like chemotaxis protein|uniref:response regulator n=1 Tax=uncultured Bradyrhizobium sp. TaxID=199684 RepID=UPI002637BA38|nr:response regulator [uncultured Bradyrhizobium sp.]
MTLSILLVEDEVMIRMMVADMVETLGHQIAAEAGNIDQAMELAQSASFDFAIIDMNLNGIMSFPIADAIASREIPFIFASGYGSTRDFGQQRQALVLQKPFTIENLETAIKQAQHVES